MIIEIFRGYGGKFLISKIEIGSLAQELELKAGDKILEVNGQKPLDIIDLSFFMAEEEIELLIEHADGERELIEFEKDVDEELGAEFESAVFDGIRRCKNHCVFCFVDMIAPNMRRTLSIKDDDYRLSFLFGNFITLTNLTAKDFRRIKKYHLSPLFVSIHAMNPDLRAKILRTPLGAKIQTQLDELEKAGVEYHTQVVLCKDLNDGAELDFTISEILKRRPHALSLAIVPVGVTRHRRDKFPLKQFDKESAAKVIAQVEAFQKKIRAESGKTFVYLGDEFYLLAEKNLPPAEFYDDFPQIENGIGMTRNFIEEMRNAQCVMRNDFAVDVICGTSFAKVLKELVADNPNVRIVPVVNKFFGERVNVSGLLTGGDIIEALRGGERDLILIPATALKAGEEIFLDDVTLDDLRKIFAPAKILPIHDGAEFKKVLGGNFL
ncbi:MAG: DUF512 domain-containing protein [Selenomonadaceae bacterium]|nr:DUF512 domain-containing protein [Selenomonadaceae bacterium]MBR7024636.1 DUF512 domain-containing protein [Selenomonadaceae bacterium]